MEQALLIDTHCHLTSPELARQRRSVIERARAAGVEKLITVATTPDDARAALEWMPDEPDVLLAIGIHPHQAGKATPQAIADLSELHRGKGLGPVAGERVVAVGEAGLDFHYDFATPQRQEEVFRAQIELALAVGRPLIIHARKAEARVCDILSDYPALAGRVVFHCYSESVEIARRILELGHCVSFTGVVTFSNAELIRASARFVPGDRFMVETDAPFLSPEPVRKVRPNEPAFVAHTARYLADIRGEDMLQLAARTTATARRFFGIDSDGRAGGAGSARE